MAAVAVGVSVLTAAGRLDPGHLVDAYQSLLAQDGIEWEWVIQLDGKQRPLPDVVVGDERVCVAENGSRLGAAITRNRALMRCEAEYVQNLDDDDMLVPGALSVLRGALDEHQGCAFAFGDGYNADEHGVPRVRWTAPHVVLAPGDLFDRWLADGWEELSFPPLAPGGVMWRRSVLFAEAGWRAMSACEDTALVMSAAEKHPSVGVGVETIGVREHPNRSTRSQAVREVKAQHWEFIRRQVLAQRRLRRVAAEA
jgi:cellulose synthase/poly-beta-1,6-N-acetylglucosamine synthase-like glycosyltransferase